MAKNKNRNLFKRGGTWYFRRRVRDKRTRKDRWIKEALSRSLTEARKIRDQRLKEILIYGDIVHEMTHLIEPKHNDKFIAILEEHYPNWREARAELNELPLSAEEWKSDSFSRP